MQTVYLFYRSLVNIEIFKNATLQNCSLNCNNMIYKIFALAFSLGFIFYKLCEGNTVINSLFFSLFRFNLPLSVIYIILETMLVLNNFENEQQELNFLRLQLLIRRYG